MIGPLSAAIVSSSELTVSSTNRTVGAAEVRQQTNRAHADPNLWNGKYYSTLYTLLAQH